MKTQVTWLWFVGMLSLSILVSFVHADNTTSVTTKECVRLAEINGVVSYEVKIRWVKEVHGGQELYRMKVDIKNVTNSDKKLEDFRVHGQGEKTGSLHIPTDFDNLNGEFLRAGKSRQYTSDRLYKPELVEFIELEITEKYYNNKYEIKNNVNVSTCVNGESSSANHTVYNPAAYPVQCEISVSADYPGWDPVVTPNSFDISAEANTVLDFDFQVPESCHYGNKFDFTCYNLTDNDSSYSEHIAYLTEDIPGGLSVTGFDTLRYQWMNIEGNVQIEPDAGLSIDNSVINMMTYNSYFNVESGGRLSLSNCTIEPDSGQRIYYIMFSGNGGLNIENVSIIGSDNGIAIVEGVEDLHIDGLVISNCYYLGIELAGCTLENQINKTDAMNSYVQTNQSNMLSCVIVDSIGGDGILIDYGTQCKFENAWIGNVGGYDLVVKDNSEAYMLSSNFNDNNVFVEAGSKLTRAWRFSGMITDRDSNLPNSYDVTILDTDDQIAYSEESAIGGLIGPVELTQWVDMGGEKIYKTPHNISITGHFDWGDCDTTFSATMDEDLSANIQMGFVSGIHKPVTSSELPRLLSTPNPFRGTTHICYQLPRATRVSIKIHNIVGQLVQTLVCEKKKSGYHIITWDGLDNKGKRVPPGIYLFTIQADDYTETKRMIMIR